MQHIDKSCFNWVRLVKRYKMPSIANHLCLYLSTFMNTDHDIAWPSIARITHETGLSKPTVVKWLAWLEDEGWLVINRSARSFGSSGGVQKNNEYIPDIPIKVVKELYHPDKGGKSGDQRWLISEQKVVKELNPNNNIITNNNKGQFYKNAKGELIPL